MSDKLETTKQERQKLESEVRNVRKRVVAAAAKAKARGHRKAGAISAGPKGGKPPKKLPLDSEVDMPAIQALLPEGARIVRDDYNSRFKCWFKRQPFSRSWATRGSSEALKEILRWAWSEAQRYGYDCPIEGLLSSPGSSE